MFRAALILDFSVINKWQKDALDAACDYLDIKLVLSCTNTRYKKKIFKTIKIKNSNCKIFSETPNQRIEYLFLLIQL